MKLDGRSASTSPDGLARGGGCVNVRKSLDVFGELWAGTRRREIVGGGVGFWVLLSSEEKTPRKPEGLCLP